MITKICSSAAVKKCKNLFVNYVKNLDIIEKFCIQNSWKLFFTIKQEKENLNPLTTLQNIKFQKFHSGVVP